MRAVDLIQRKQGGGELSAEEIDFFIDGYTRGDIPDYQASAFTMAVFFKGMSPAEISALTESMMRSGEVLDLSFLPGPKADKHSTGGVGDKTSLIVGPLAAACGVYVPMISGRGLGHTGGTLDKLESIPGFRVGLELSEFRAVLARCGLALIGQTPEIAPADRRLYALRDVTATVASLPLIAASIMSKKMAEGIDALVLDVKTGDGAFLPSREECRALAETMIGIGRAMGTQGRGAADGHGPAPRPGGGQRPRGRREHRDAEGARAPGPRVPLDRAGGTHGSPRHRVRDATWHAARSARPSPPGRGWRSCAR